jgi:hypothetical protein
MGIAKAAFAPLVRASMREPLAPGASLLVAFCGYRIIVASRAVISQNYWFGPDAKRLPKRWGWHLH